MDEYLRANQKRWDQLTIEHQKSVFYDVEGFKAGKDRLRSIELEELGDVSGKSMLHLQCHFGLDTLAWARRGAKITGVDFSQKAITLAKALSEELDIPAEFICADVFDLPGILVGEFDLVFTSYGVLHGLPGLKRWGEVIAHFLRPGGILYIVEDHPMFRVFQVKTKWGIQGTLVVSSISLKIIPCFFRSKPNGEFKAERSYFFSEEPQRIEGTGSYATDNQGSASVSYVWDFSMGDVINSLIEAGLLIEFLHEFPFAARAKFPFMEQGEDGWWRLPEPYHGTIPFLFSLQARKPI
jgi:SAM-dependent methyltransferase